MVGIQDFLKYVSLSDMSVAPDQDSVFFVVSQPVLEQNRYSRELWYGKLSNEFKPVRILCDGEFTGTPSWGENGKLRFTRTNTSGSVEFCEMNPASDSTEIVTAFEAGALNVYALPDGSFAYTKQECLIKDDYPAELSFLKDYSDGFETIDEIPCYDNGRGFVSGKRVALYIRRNTGETVRVTAPETTVDRILQKKEGLYYSARTYRGRNTEPGIYFLAVGTEQATVQVPEGIYRFYEFDAALDENGLEKVYLGAQDKRVDTMSSDVTFYCASRGDMCRLSVQQASLGDGTGHDCVYGGGHSIRMQNGKLYTTITREWDSVVRCSAADGTSCILTPGDGCVTDFSVLKDGRLLLIAMRGQGLPEIYMCRDGKLTQLTSFNTERLNAADLMPTETFTFKNHGFNVNYVVLKPMGYDPEKKYPAILYVHGGAKMVYTKVFFHEMQYLAGKGYFVIYGNPRGSDGQGSEFADLLGHYGEPDYEDMMKAIDEAIRLYPAIDVDRLGVAGGSYGGIMTNWIITHTDRFKAAVAQRSICSMVSTFGTADNGFNFVKEQMGGDLWNGFDDLWRQSPLKYANHCHTPLLLIHSTEDYRCHYTEAIQMFTALRYLDVETKVCLIRGENHNLSRCGRPVQRIKRLYEIGKWFDEHLKGNEA